MVTSVSVTLAFKKVQKNNFYSNIIGRWTKSEYSHVELILGDTWISSVEGKGVHLKNLKPKREEYDYVELEMVVLTEKQYADIYTWLYKQNNKKYDTVGILFSQIIPLRLDSRNKWFCSELVTKILQLLNIPEVIDLYPHLTSPGDLAKIFKLES